MNIKKSSWESLTENRQLCIRDTFCHRPDRGHSEVGTRVGYQVVDDLHNSDHYPIIISDDTSNSFPSLRKRCRMETANWENYSTQIKSRLQGENSSTELFPSNTEESALQNGHTVKKSHKIDDQGTTRADSPKEKSREKIAHHKTDENLIEYHRLKATSRLLYPIHEDQNHIPSKAI
jgi:hypothetical protein